MLPVPELTAANKDRVMVAEKTEDAIAALPSPLPGPQSAYVNSEADICIYGGAAGGGKTMGTLIDFARPEFLELPGYGAVIFRRTCPQITNEGGLWDESAEIYPSIGGEPVQSRMEWQFPSGATIRFAHLQHEKNKFDWQGAQIPRIGFDELTHFTETQFFYLLTRARTTIGIKPQIRATCNPDADSWVAKFIEWWIDQDSGFPIPERSGVIRWFVRVSGEMVWADSVEELKRSHPNLEPKSVTFIPSKITDNTVLLSKDPGYLANLMAQHPVERARLLEGNWKVRHEAGKFINRAWIEVVDHVPNRGSEARAWDLAATKKQTAGDDPDWTVGIKMKRVGNIYYITDAQRMQENPGEVKRAIANIASQDGSQVPIGLPQDPGQAGKDQLHTYRKELKGYAVRGNPTRGDKLERARPFAVECEAGNVKMLRAGWNEAVLSTLHSVPDGAHDDDLDACGDAHRMLAAKNYTPPTGTHQRTGASVRVYGK